MGAAADESRPPPQSHLALFLRFLGFGCLAFGGPVAQIAMIRRALVEEERWIAPDRFNRLLTVLQALPGPEAHELCVHLGTRAKGRLGGLLAGLGFMLPGLALMLLAAWLYERLNLAAPLVSAAFLGLQAAALGLVAVAAWRLGRHLTAGPGLLSVAAAAAALALAAAPFWLVLPTAGVAYALWRSGRRSLAVLIALGGAALALWLRSPDLAPGVPVSADADASAWLLFLTGVKAGLLTFGGAYTAIPFLRADAAAGGWATDAQVLEGVALASVLPAPLVIFATFVGYQAGGVWGALAITAGVFLPAFAFSLILYERLEAVVEHPPLHAFLEGVGAAVAGLIAVTAVQLALGLTAAHPAIRILPIALAAATLALFWRHRLSAPVAIVLGGLASAALWG